VSACTWSATKNLRWVRTLSHPGAAICITASTSALAKVVHYAGLVHGLRRGPVEEVPFAHFARGQCVWVRSGAPSDFDAEEVIGRARSRVGEDRYRLLTNNCEHFCEWCLHGTARSFQVEAWLARPTLTLLATLCLTVPISSLLR
jgi:hypothetical protein